MAVGMPCIAFNVGGIPSMMDDEENGLLFESKNSQELANKIMRIINDEKIRYKLAQNAEKKAYSRNSEKVVIYQIIY